MIDYRMRIYSLVRIVMLELLKQASLSPGVYRTMTAYIYCNTCWASCFPCTFEATEDATLPLIEQYA